MTRQNCSHSCSTYHQAIEFIGKRWMGMIIYTLITGPKRYHEIHSMIPGISDRLLTDRLNELVEAGLVYKKFIDSSIKKVEYGLTPNGLAFQDVIKAIQQWIDLCGFEKLKTES
ncbi:winged helix-turn-helix transcriptional regulator [Bhargavaea beijingensis]|nr:helix-turn-helix domain-containing protein [Bhargavaea beijingensis]MCW1927511.1 helix-turn-helix transcriptional regulator [Bhargavaea beijingensis]SDE58768.1 transcriptional regulator, HxlR family [Bhargavaea beijingensis]